MAIAINNGLNPISSEIEVFWFEPMHTVQISGEKMEKSRSGGFENR